MIRAADKRWLIVTVIALGALCFSQVYTVVHIHHSHDSSLLPFEISFHPIDFDPDHVPGHHGGKEHHPSFEQDYSKWLLTRCQQAGPKPEQAPLCVIGTREIPTPGLLGISPAAPDLQALVDQSARFKCDPRSPPPAA